MTHHITAKSLKERVVSSPETFNKTKCSWCQTEANYWTSINEGNFVPIEGKTLDGEQAFAVYCPDCLKDPNRSKEVKYAFTLTGDNENPTPSQTVFRDLRDRDDTNEVEEIKPVPKEETAGTSVVQARADEQQDKEEKKGTTTGVLGKLLKKDETK